MLVGPEGLTHHESTFARPEVVVGIANLMPDGADRATIEALADIGLRHSQVIPLIPHTPLDDLTPAQPTPVDTDLDDPTITAPEPDIEPTSDTAVEVSVAVERRYTTVDLLETEQRIIDRATTGIGAHRWRAPAHVVDRTLDQYPHLTLGQQTLVRQIATSGNAVDVGVGAAGTGKSAALAVVKALTNRTDTPIIGTALAARAAAGLQASTSIPSTTITRLLSSADTDGLPTGAVVIVDEAGMVGTRHLAAISDHVETAGGKLVLVGDHRQLPEIQAGGLFRVLTARLPSVELTDNVRQIHPWERDALNELRDGSVSRAIAMYSRRGHIRTSPRPEDAITQAIDHWHHDVTDTGDVADVLLIAHDNQTVDTLNTLARTRRATDGHLTGPTLTINNLPYQAGDRVVCGRNSTHLGVHNGDLGTITQIDPNTGAITVSLDTGETHTIPHWYIHDGHLNHGYAITGHKAQGATAQIAHTVITNTINREWLYVTLSRGRQHNTLHLITPDPTDDCHHLTHHTTNPHQALIASLERTGAKHPALDHIPPTRPTKRAVGHDLDF